MTAVRLVAVVAGSHRHVDPGTDVGKASVPRRRSARARRATRAGFEPPTAARGARARRRDAHLVKVAAVVHRKLFGSETAVHHHRLRVRRCLVDAAVGCSASKTTERYLRFD